MVDEYILDIKKYAKDKNVPIMMDDGIKFLINYIKETKRYNILEIGTAIGYSSILMALQDENIKVTTIEKDEVRYKEALKNIKNLGLDGRINPIFNDALNVTLNDTYDLIFIDAAKSKNEELFIKFSNEMALFSVTVWHTITGIVSNSFSLKIFFISLAAVVLPCTI